MNFSITGGFLQAFSGQNRCLVASEDAWLRKESFESVCKFKGKLMFTITGGIHHDNALFRKFESHLRTYEKGYGFYSNYIVQEKYSSRNTVLLWDIVP
jgi:hypothetical protein